MCTTVHSAQRLEVEPVAVSRLLREQLSGALYVVTSHGCLKRATLRLATDPEPASEDCLQLFEQRGLLLLGGWPVRVRLECTPWSETTSELGIRPTRLGWAVGGRWYSETVSCLLHQLVWSLEVAADARGNQEAPAPEAEDAAPEEGTAIAA
jgi:hypothetical protein